MSYKEITILGINPGTKYMAFALFRRTELREWFVRGFKGVWSAGKKKKILAVIAELIRSYGVTVLVIKELHPSRTSRHLDSLVDAIKDLAKQQRIKVRAYSIKDLERFFCPEAKDNKQNLAEQIAAEYPVLFRELEKEKSLKNPYYTRLFEAVALGSICHSHLEKIKICTTKNKKS